MRKEEFFEVLGELDDDMVEEAKTTGKKKAYQKVWGPIAACFAVVCAAAFCFINLNTEEVPPQGIADFPPMVYVNDTLYIQSGDQQSYAEQKDEFLYLGTVQSTTATCEASAPNRNFQANSLIVGCEIYQYGENIVVRINGSYWLYTKCP